MTSSMNMLQITTRTPVIKPSPFNPHPSLIPQYLNTPVFHPSPLTTKVNPLFPTNPFGIIPHLHPDLLLARSHRGSFGRRSYSLLEGRLTVSLIILRFQILPDSVYCRLYVLTVVIQTAVDLAIEGELLVRFHQAGIGLGEDTAAATRKMTSMNVYLGIFVLAQ